MKISVKSPAVQFASAAAIGAVVGTVGTFAAVNVAFSAPKTLSKIKAKRRSLKATTPEETTAE